MTSPPSSGYERTRVTSPAPSRVLHLLSIYVYRTGQTSAASAPERLSADRRSADRRVVAPEGPRAFRSPAGQGPVVDHHLDGGTRETPDPFGRRGGADDDVRSPHQATQRGPLGGTDPDEAQCSAGWRSRSSAPGCGAVSTVVEATPARVPDGNWARRWRVSRCASASSAITGTPSPSEGALPAGDDRSS